jgi:predicted nucleic acid-binding protein
MNGSITFCKTMDGNCPNEAARTLKMTGSNTKRDDEPDNRILECAQRTGTEVIVTGDKHLLDLVAFEGIKIIRIADFQPSNNLA